MSSMRLAIMFLFFIPHAGAEVVERSLGSAVERHVSPNEPARQWVHDLDIWQEDLSDILATVEVDRTESDIVKLKGVVPPIHFASGIADIPSGTIRNLQSVLQSLANRENVRLHLVGHADNQRLSPRLIAIYGDNAGLSEERAGEVAEYFQGALSLSADAISYEWAGDSRPIADNATEAGRYRNRRVEVEVWYDEIESEQATEKVVIANETKRVKICRIDTVCKLNYQQGHNKRARVQNLIAPLNYDESGVEIGASFIEKVRRSLANLGDRENVVVRFIGHTDSEPLDDRALKIYGDHVGLAKARAWRVALALQDSLDLPSGSVEATGLGNAQPLATESSAEGRTLNRRVDVEFWYDDPLQELPDEPQLCPVADEQARVARVHRPSWGELPKLSVGRGEIVLPADLDIQVNRALAEVADKLSARVRFVGYTANEILERRTAAAYEDDIGLSTARARRAMDAVVSALGLAREQVEFEGRGYVHADDVVNTGFVQGSDSFVAIEVVYDEPAANEALDGLIVQPMRRELQPENAFALNMMRVTVDGEPVDDKDRSSADIQRCTDVALQESDFQMVYNNLSVERRLSVDARIDSSSEADAQTETVVDFRVHTNYHAFIDRFEIRVLEQGTSNRATPIAVIDVDEQSIAQWSPGAVEDFSDKQIQYVVRAYDADGAFDETVPRTLHFVRQASPKASAVDENGSNIELLAGYGTDELALQNIRLSSGVVSVKGEQVPPGYGVWVAGHPVPVDPDGKFVSEQILPEGAHTVEVAILDEQGSGELFFRDLVLEPTDWFYVGMADLTIAQSTTSGAADVLSGDTDLNEELTGRLAFFANGKFANKWHLTTSVDTREGPVKDLFKNFVNKSPDALFRRIDPAYHYPTFGDDSRVEELAPTSGKFYLKGGRLDTHALWGNYNVNYDQNELARVDRGLYGLNLHHESQASTDFGERRFVIDGFAAEPGTVPARQEFRGTGGSLYFLRHQDLLMGSERVSIEMRNPASGLVTRSISLSPSLDYDIDYLQGTIMLAEPLSSTVDNDMLVRSSGVSGDDAHLVVRYEFTPGFDEIDSVVTGAQGHYWISDYLKVGVTGSLSELDGVDSDLQAGHIVLRQSADSWVKLQHSEAGTPFSDTFSSLDGGFGFDPVSSGAAVQAAAASRVDVSVGVGDLVEGASGRVTLYKQNTDAGFSTPGLISPRETDFQGGTLLLPVGDQFRITGASDTIDQTQGLYSARHELNIEYDLNERWDIGAGVREDTREDASGIFALSQELGNRTDAVVKLGYESIKDWSLYGYVQDTVRKDETREDNGRVGVGGSYQWSEAVRMDAEVSEGDSGLGAIVGTRYTVSDRTSLYLNYALENERADNVLRTNRGRGGSLVSGAKSRLSDSTSVYAEQRYRHGTNVSGHTYATGVNYQPTQSWNLGATTDIGTHTDLQTGTETERNAAGMRASYTLGRLFLSAGAEYRQDEGERLGAPTEDRKTWLLRSSLKFQMSQSGRFLGQFNHSESESSLGQFYDGGFTEATVGYALRPVNHDRINALAKYTYFYNVPTAGQVTLKGSAAQYIQESHVASLDVNYDLTTRWSLGGKYAHRIGKISVDRDELSWFDNRAHLYVLRTSYRLFEKWEVLVEGRQLSMPDFEETRTGGLASVSRQIGDHLKVGVGYNFTEFSDDLTDLDFNHRGAFLNVTGII